METSTRFNNPGDRRRRRPSRARAAGLAAVALLLLAPLALAQLKLPGRESPGAPDPTDPAKLVELSLISEQDALVPGRPSWLALRFEIHQGWHLYWRNNGDTGAPMSISFDAPEGVKVGAVQYPAPHWHAMPGGYVDFVYEHEVMLLVPVMLDPGQPLGASVTIGATVDFLVCKDSCIAGQATSSVELPIRGQASPTDAAPRFAATRLRMPRAMSEARAAGIDARWQTGPRLLIQAPGASRLTFFPLESATNAYPEDIAETARVSGETLILRYDERAADAELIGGVLEVRSQTGTAWYEIVVGPPPLPSHAPQPRPTGED